MTFSDPFMVVSWDGPQKHWVKKSTHYQKDFSMLRHRQSNKKNVADK